VITAKDRLACSRVLCCHDVWSTRVPRGRAYGIKPVAFKTDGVEGGKRKVELCGCKYTNTPPYCDGSVRAASLSCRFLLLHHTTTCYSRTSDASPFVLVCLFDFVATPPRMWQLLLTNPRVLTLMAPFEQHVALKAKADAEGRV
jgi:hypothetical protein